MTSSRPRQWSQIYFSDNVTSYLSQFYSYFSDNVTSYLSQLHSMNPITELSYMLWSHVVSCQHGRGVFHCAALCWGEVLQDAHHMISRPIICLEARKLGKASMSFAQSVEVDPASISLHHSYLILPARCSDCWEFECDMRVNICWPRLVRTTAKTDAFARNNPVEKTEGKGDGKVWPADNCFELSCIDASSRYIRWNIFG